MSQVEEKKELVEQYKKLYDKAPFAGWDEDKLKEMIEKFGKTEEKPKVENTFKGVNINPNETYHFRLLKRANPRSIMPREAKVWDDETETARTIRLCSTEKSPYMDEQKEDAPLDSTTPVFTDGNLWISGMEQMKVKFMLAFDGYNKKKKILPNNEWNRGMYELVNQQEINEDKVKKAEDVMDAKDIIKKSKTSDLRNFMRSVFLTPVDGMSDAQVKVEAYEYADISAETFIKEFTDPRHEIKANVQKLLSKGELTADEGVVKWTDTKAKVIEFDPKKESADDVVTKWVILGDKISKEFKERMELKLK